MAMALCLHELGISSTVYESRADLGATLYEGGGMMIAANALRILDRLGVYKKMTPHGYPFEYVNYKNENEETVDRFPFGNRAVFGYGGLRIYRQTLIRLLLETCVEKGVRFEFGKKFVRVVEETADDVTFEFADGTTRVAQMMIGADGIHSKVRDSHITKGAVQKEFTNLVGIVFELDGSKLRLPADKNYVFPLQLNTNRGSFVLAPQTPDGRRMLAGTQFRVADKTREEWAAFTSDKRTLSSMLRENMDSWPDAIKSALENINEDTFNVWPFYRLPSLESWASETYRRVVLVGDAAHAVPPTTGLGASMALEDVYALSLLLKELREEPRLQWADAVKFWEGIRQKRIGDILTLTKQLNNKRLPTDKQAEIIAQFGPQEVWADRSEEDPTQMAWLYDYSVARDIDEWAAEVLSKQ